MGTKSLQRKLLTQEEMEARIYSKFSRQETDQFHDWLNERREFDYGWQTINCPRWWRACYLLCRNGSWIVEGWGITSSGGLFGLGLGQSDAMELMTIHGILTGASLGLVYDPFDEFLPVFEEFVKVHVELKELEEQNGRV